MYQTFLYSEWFLLLYKNAEGEKFQNMNGKELLSS